MRVLGLNAQAARGRAMQLLERVRIPEQANKYPAQLSGGQQQRVAIARSLCMQPKVMLFDEPTSALDPEMTAEVLDALEDIRQEGKTLILATHATSFARRTGGRVAFLRDHRLEWTGSTQDFFQSPPTEAARTYLAKILKD
jgi:ABC-type polar amino acid transport system ATPase subunit